jgi:hypothetical protein
MQNELYSVVLRFDPADQETCAHVRDFLQGFKNLDPGRIEAALGKGRLLLKRNADHAAALKLQQRIRVNGATFSLEKQSHRQISTGKTLKLGFLNQKEDRKSQDGASREIICPKCRTRQPHLSECRRCGVVFAKIRSTPKTDDARTEPSPVPEAEKKAQNHPDRTETFFQRHLPAIKALNARLTQWRRHLQQWSQKPLNALFNCAMLFLTALLLNIFLLSLGKYLWFIYTATTVGEHFMKNFSGATAVIEALLGRDPVILAWEVAFLVLGANLLMALFSQFTHISRLYLDSGGFMIKLIWIVSSTLGTAWLLSRREPMPPLAVASTLTLMPTLCLLGGCLNLARALLPEMGAVFSEISRAVRHNDSLVTALINIYRNWEQLKTGKKTAPTPAQGDADV